MTLQSLGERLLMRIGHSRRVDGLWIGVNGDKSDDDALARVEQALCLIKRYDPIRYNRIHRYLDAIWVCHLPGLYGQFRKVYKRCDIDMRSVRRSTSERIAAVIIHESTHAHPSMIKIGYAEHLRHRAEALCMRQELAFARKLPNGQELREGVELRLASEPSTWSNDALRRLRLDGEFAMARAAGIPDWVTKSIIAARDAGWRLRRALGG
jgi:hypothetical protein